MHLQVVAMMVFTLANELPRSDALFAACIRMSDDEPIGIMRMGIGGLQDDRTVHQ
jgi:hypothetical protein